MKSKQSKSEPSTVLMPADVKTAIKGVIKFASENPKLQNNLFNEEFPLFLQINSFKIPKSRGAVKKVFRVPLAHSPLSQDPDVCLIVPDVKGIPNKEHERHLEHYETLLRSKDVTGIKKIMTFHEFRTEYDTFELKQRLVDLYDIFLVDGRISGKVVHKGGSIFYNKRKVPIAVKLHLPKLKSHLEESLKKAFLLLNWHSDSHAVQIGHSKMKVSQLAANVNSVVRFIEKQFPGGMENVRSLNVYAFRGSSVPVYLSLKDPNEVEVPTLTTRKPKSYKQFSGELTTQYNANILVKPSGQVVVRRSKKYNQNNQDENITDADILRENKKSAKGEGETKQGKKRKMIEQKQEKNVVEKKKIKGASTVEKKGKKNFMVKKQTKVGKKINKS
ncbi:ribosomal L1 domain-containing protein 1-like [Anthonomus grandis grandis]|uniref:ribosomal L1 domain-containing protein 1-like n=1 Tax=Anthonomus grandis grandis TaxID=2921223 RepID=UPI00216501B3|nr:ribosomal L1 domain-containing protein 1-like [Anthonomus grandis grandis]